MIKPVHIPGRLGKRGTYVIPAALRKRYGLEDGSMVVAEPGPDGILIRPAAAMPVEIYTDARKAEFLLNNAVDEKDYAWALKEVRKLGIDPKTVPHEPPRRRKP